MPGEPEPSAQEAQAWDMLERVNLFLIQFRSDLAKGVPVENELFLGTIRNWYRLSRDLEEMLRARGLLEVEQERRASPCRPAGHRAEPAHSHRLRGLFLATGFMSIFRAAQH